MPYSEFQAGVIIDGLVVPILNRFRFENLTDIDNACLILRKWLDSDAHPNIPDTPAYKGIIDDLNDLMGDDGFELYVGDSILSQTRRYQPNHESFLSIVEHLYTSPCPNESEEEQIVCAKKEFRDIIYQYVFRKYNYLKGLSEIDRQNLCQQYNTEHQRRSEMKTDFDGRRKQLEEKHKEDKDNTWSTADAEQREIEEQRLFFRRDLMLRDNPNNWIMRIVTFMIFPIFFCLFSYLRQRRHRPFDLFRRAPQENDRFRLMPNPAHAQEHRQEDEINQPQAQERARLLNEEVSLRIT